MSGNGHPTEWMSAWVNMHLQPIMKGLPTYLKDTNHLLHLLSDTHTTPNSRIISLDVTSLYTNIPQELGLRAIYEVGKMSFPNKDFTVVTEIAKLVLENNIFNFNDTHYIQIEGTVMGTRLAPAYANISMYKIWPSLAYMCTKVA